MNNETSKNQGIVFSIQYFSIHDGPGIRTTVFLKGCNMNCAWCHNAESILPEKELSYIDKKCIGCRICEQECPKVHSFLGDKHIIKRENCTVCGKCIASCPSSALSIIGYEADADEIIKNVIKDKRYYGKDGGMTISGGEPTCQAEFIKALLFKAKKNCINTAVETNGYFFQNKNESILFDADLVLFDYKVTDDTMHKKMTGVSNKQIKKNLEELCKTGVEMILRCPIIPSINDDDLHFKAIADITKKHDNILGFEVMPYHDFGVGKSEQVSNNAQNKFRVPDKEEVETWIKRIIEFGGREWRG